eukprot:11209307-Lingulodinium_polyedra.AAC.1
MPLSSGGWSSEVLTPVFMGCWSSETLPSESTGWAFFFVVVCNVAVGVPWVPRGNHVCEDAPEQCVGQRKQARVEGHGH